MANENREWMVVPSVATIILLVVGFVKSWLVLKVLGLLILAGLIVAYIIYRLNLKSGEDIMAGIGCFGSFLVVSVLFTTCINSKERFIAPDNNYQHLYKDCSTISDTIVVKEVIAMDGYLYCCWKNCPDCKQRLKAEEKFQRAVRQEKERQEKIAEYEDLIRTLEERIEKLKAGARTEEVEPIYNDEAEEEEIGLGDVVNHP